MSTRSQWSRVWSRRRALRKLILLDYLLKADRVAEIISPLKGANADRHRVDRMIALRTSIARQVAISPKIGFSRSQDVDGLMHAIGLARDVVQKSGALHCDAVDRCVIASITTPLSAGAVALLGDAIEFVCLEALSDAIVDTIHHSAPCNRVAIATILGTLQDVWLVGSGEIAKRAYCWEPMLEADPSGLYRAMTDTTKNAYRIAVEKTAKTSGHAIQSVIGSANQRAADLGCHSGQIILSANHATGEKLRLGPLHYMAALSLVSALLASLITFNSQPMAANQIAGTIAFCCFFAPVIYEGLHLIARRTFAARYPARTTPMMQPAWVTAQEVIVAVAVPTLVDDSERFETLVERLCETQKLLPRQFVIILLTDFAESPSEQPPQGAIRSLQNAIARVDAEPAASGVALLHRDRAFFAAEGSWRGWGRKLGKLQTLDRFIVDGVSEFAASAGAVERIRAASHVIVLDDDTNLEVRDALALLGASLHPLNVPVIEPNGANVKYGYGALAPMTSPAPRQHRNIFSEVIGGIPLNPRSLAHLRDFNFDAWGARQFSGKGIRQVATAHTLLSRLDPERLLSHDVIEGAILKTAFCPSALLFDVGDSSYIELTVRRERWTRGDIQNFLMLIGRSRNIGKLSSMGTYLIIDNARKAFLPPFHFIAVVLLISDLVRFQVSFALIVLLTPLAIELVLSFLNLLNNTLNGTLFYQPQSKVAEIFVFLRREIVRLAILPHLAIINGLAILKATLRILTSRDLLEWTPFSNKSGGALAQKIQFRIWCASSIASAVGLVSSILIDSASPITVAVLLLWSLSPFFEMYIRKSPNNKISGVR